MKILYLIIFASLLISCNNAELEAKVKKLEKENKELSEKKIDSIAIYTALDKDQKRKKAHKLLDSIKTNDKRFYESLKEVLNEEEENDEEGYLTMDKYY